MLLLGLVGFIVLMAVVCSLYLRWYFSWESRQTSGMAYYGRPLAERRALKNRIRWFSLPARPLVGMIAAANRRTLTMPTFEYGGVSGPPKVSSPQAFEQASKYRPRPEDVFVVTQMRCGTTWMQQIVYQVVTRGRGDAGGDGGHLYAISPWIDGANSVSMKDAPLVGERPTRIIKSHLPTALCPYSADARYIYVTRHPVSCFASIVDYNRSLLGPLMPTAESQAEWFCSTRMYWSPWPTHVDGWWQWATAHDNVLFVHFEDMTKQFGPVLDRIARFLGYDLTDDERRLIAERCSFEYMKQHEELFEMAPPTMFSVRGGEFLKSGKASRHSDVSSAVRARILDYCRTSLSGSRYPAGQFYPDLQETGATTTSIS
jgi:hypothetical protein